MLRLSSPPAPRRSAPRSAAVLPLQQGDRLTSAEFLRRYEAMPGLKKAELIEGTVHMPSPVRADAHGEPDGLIHVWLGYFAFHSRGTKFYPNTTLITASDNTSQPDAILCSAPRAGSKVWLDEKGYLHGAPELVCEIAASTASIDLHDKLRAYRRAGIAEYLVWVVADAAIRWFVLEDEEYVEQAGRAGVLTSRAFPKLALDTRALLRGDGAKVIAALRKRLGK